MLVYADEDVDFPVVEELRALGHDVITAQEDSHRSIDDSLILARAQSMATKEFKWVRSSSVRNRS